MQSAALAVEAESPPTATSNNLVTVPETTLPSGRVVPAFLVGKYHCSKGEDGTAVISETLPPWVSINYFDAIAAIKASGFEPLTESRALALAHNIAQQDENWTDGKVGEGRIYRGIHTWEVNSAQPGTHAPTGEDERNWHALSNGERVYNVSGNLFSWVFDDIQGDENGLVKEAFKAESPSITTAPADSLQKGVGWYPSAGSNWSGRALVRGGYWGSRGYAGVFYLNLGWPLGGGDYVGFRCTKTL